MGIWKDYWVHWTGGGCTQFSQIPKNCKVFFNSPLPFCGLLSRVKRNRFVNVFFRFLWIYWWFFGLISFRFVHALSCFVSVVSRFVSFRFCLFRFVSFLLYHNIHVHEKKIVSCFTFTLDTIAVFTITIVKVVREWPI